MGSAALRSVSNSIKENNQSSKKSKDREPRGSFSGLDELSSPRENTSQQFITRSSSGNGPGNEEKTLLDTLEERRIDLGETHHMTLDIMKALVKYYCKQSAYDKALPLLQSCLSVSVLTFGSSSTETLGFMNELGNLYYKQGKYDLALHQYTTCLEKRQISEGSLSVLTLMSQNNVGLTLMKNEEKLLEAKKIMKVLFVFSIPNFVTCFNPYSTNLYCFACNFFFCRHIHRIVWRNDKRCWESLIPIHYTHKLIWRIFISYSIITKNPSRRIKTFWKRNDNISPTITTLRPMITIHCR